MKRLLLLAVAGVWFAAEAAPFKFAAKADRESCVYKCGETAVFTLTITDLGTDATNRPVKVQLDNFGDEVIETREILTDRKETVLEMKGTLKKPGFMRITAIDPTCPKDGLWSVGKGNLCDSVGFEPEKIKASVPCPKDFDSYWDGERSRLRKEVPLDAKIEPVESFDKEGFKAYTVSFATFNGKRVYGWIVEPAAPGKYPIHFRVPGAGPSMNLTQLVAEEGRIRVILNVHPQPVPATPEEAKKVYPGGNYPVKGVGESREAHYYHDVLLGMDRAVDWIVARPNVDRKRVAYSGGSQGGGFGCYLLGLNRSFTRGLFWITAITDVTGYKVGRQSGWPSMIERTDKDKKSVAEQVAPYYDAVNFSRRIRVPVRVFAGLSDMVCPPHAVTSAFNRLATKDKEIRYGAGLGHTVPRDGLKAWHDWLKE